jgi:hypothetical protein
MSSSARKEALLRLAVGTAAVLFGCVGFFGMFSLTRSMQMGAGEMQMPSSMPSAPRGDFAYDMDGMEEDKEEVSAKLERTKGAERERPNRQALAKRKEGKSVLSESDDIDLLLSDEEQPASEGESSGEGVARAWFPETFLWEPVVQTDEQGRAQLALTVPDQLTTWRVLALAHSAAGLQAGAVHTFEGTLPAYVQPLVPARLYVGDRIVLPVRVVNQTEEPLSSSLSIRAQGVMAGASQGPVALPAFGSDLAFATLTAEAAGTAEVTAKLAGADAARHSIDVWPTGRPVTSSRGGTLSGPRTIRWTAPAGADPSTQRVEVRAFGSPLAVVEAELRRGVAEAEPAYGFALARRYAELAELTGAKIDAGALRRLRQRSWQGLVQRAGSPNATTAADVLLGLRGVTEHPLAEAFRTRMTSVLVSAQRGDGTWAPVGGKPTLQAVVVHTARAAYALDGADEWAALKAAGAMERHTRTVEDSYTASVVLASGLLEGTQRDALLALLVEGVVENSDGGRSLAPLPGGVRNAAGRAPSHSERLAWATLALLPEDLAWKGDLSTELMARYDLRQGFGSAGADIVVLDAIASAMPALAEPVQVVLSVNGREVSRATVDPAQPGVPAQLAAPAAGTDVAFELAVEPAVAGLAWTATLHSWVPWSGESLSGVDLEIETADWVPPLSPSHGPSHRVRSETQAAQAWRPPPTVRPSPGFPRRRPRCARRGWPPLRAGSCRGRSPAPGSAAPWASRRAAPVPRRAPHAGSRGPRRAR